MSLCCGWSVIVCFVHLGLPFALAFTSQTGRDLIAGRASSVRRTPALSEPASARPEYVAVRSSCPSTPPWATEDRRMRSALLGRLAASSRSSSGRGARASTRGLRRGDRAERWRWAAIGSPLLALALEAGLGAALLFDLRRRPVLIAATLLVVFFLFLTGRAVWREAHGIVDDSGSCGCFGALVDRTPVEAFFQDLLLLVPALAFAWAGRPGARRALALRAVAALALAAATAAFAMAAPRWPSTISDAPAPGVALDEICAGRDAQRVCRRIWLRARHGEHLVVVVDVDDPGFDALAKAERLRPGRRRGR
jgi:hypothetical protein